MSFAQTDEEKRRLWNSIGGLLIGDDTGAAVDFHVTSRAGQVVIDTKPTAATSPVIANVGGFGITLPMLLIGGVLAFLAFRK